MSQTTVFTPIRKAFQARTAREQALLAGLAVLVVLTVLWFGLLAPVMSWRAAAEQRYVNAAEGYETVLAQAAEYRALSAQAVTIGDREPLRTLADRMARERGLSISRVQPLDDGRLGVWIEQADADALMGWLSVLAREHGVSAERVSLDRDGETRVRAQLTLVRAGGAG